MANYKSRPIRLSPTIALARPRYAGYARPKTIPIAFRVSTAAAKLIRRLGTVPGSILTPLRRGYGRIYALQDRQRAQILAEITQIEGLMPLLMKQRNGIPWTSEDRQQLKKQIHSVARLSPYLLALLLPGGLLALPLVAWWLDRRRLRGKTESDPAGNESEHT